MEVLKGGTARTRRAMGEEVVRFDYLVIATGGIPRKLNVDGKDLENIYVIRTLDDAKALNSGWLSVFAKRMHGLISPKYQRCAPSSVQTS